MYYILAHPSFLYCFEMPTLQQRGIRRIKTTEMEIARRTAG